MDNSNKITCNICFRTVKKSGIKSHEKTEIHIIHSKLQGTDFYAFCSAIRELDPVKKSKLVEELAK